MQVILICKHCGKKFECVAGIQCYCSKECRIAFDTAKKKQAVIDSHKPRICKRCDKEFIPTHNSQLYCSDVCRYIRRQTQKKLAPKIELDNSKRTYTCKHCGAVFSSVRKRLFCCERCLMLWHSNYHNQQATMIKICMNCGKEYSGKNQKYCGEACKIAAEKAKKARRKKTLSIAKINEQARSQRLSYGQLVAREWMG